MTEITSMPVTMVAGAYRRAGWRATLRDRGVTIWRCQCDRPHASKSAADGCGLTALRARLGRRGMRVWSATYHPKPRHQLTPEEIARMDEERSLALLEIQTNPALPSWENPEAFPAAAEAARAAIVEYERTMLAEGSSWEEVRQTKRLLEALIEFYKDHTDIRQQAEISLLCGERRIAGEFVQAQQDGFIASRGRPWPSNSSGPDKLSIPELFGRGAHHHVRRLRTILPFDYDQIREKGRELHLAGKDATLHALSELIKAEGTKDRREASLNAEPIPDGMEYRIGDCRGAVMDDIADATVAALITDPPYGRDALPLVEFAAEFASRKLVEGGSAIFYVGTGLLPDYHAILSKYLTYWWEPVLLNDSAQKLLGAGVRASHKKILWYVKGRRRRAVHGERITIVPDVLNDYRPEEMQQDVELEERVRAMSSRDKSDHQWAQGDAGVRVWIHHLTRQGLIDPETGEILEEPELIVDLFAGTGTWGRIAADMGRRWIGCDIEAGGTEDIVADELSEAAE